jgi:xanthine dehydrogenase YagR molybdenum-binding subunit
MTLGEPHARVEALEKVTGAARYAYEHPQPDVAYCWIVPSRVAKGRIASISRPYVPGVLAVICHENALELHPVDDHELAVLQSDRVSYRGQIVAAVVAETLELAREAAAQVEVLYADEEPPDVDLRPDHPRMYRPEKVNPSYPTDTFEGDFDAAFAVADVQLDATYSTPAFHNNAMEPHATLAVWEGGECTLYDSTQGPFSAAKALSDVLGAPVRVVAPHVGGGFGSKGTPRPHAALAAMAAKIVGRPVKLAVTRQQMFSITGYRTPTIQRMRLGADRDGRLTAIGHDVWEQTSTVREFAEQTATVTRMLYAAPNRRTTHRLAALDVPTPSWMRAPGECPGSYALECAVDELALAAGIDPVELRARNDPSVDPEEGSAFSSRHLVACLREGARRFGWADRAPRREGRWLLGMGVASSTYPTRRRPSQAFARAEADGTFTVGVAAADIGTGARTVLAQIAAEVLAVPVERVRMLVGDSALPQGPVAGGSAGTASWGTAVYGACLRLRDQGLQGEATIDTTDAIEAQEDYSRHAFGAQFVEVAVDVDSGEVRVPRMLGMFACGRILNPRLARSQLIGGMTMGIGMALMEESVADHAFGDFLNHDLAQYHVPVNADVLDIEAYWMGEDDPHLNPMGSKGIGEIGIVGAAAAVANAVHHATGVRVRDLPITPDKLVGRL